MTTINRDTQVCISLSARPGGFGNLFHNFLYGELGLNFLYKGFATDRLEDAIRGVRALGLRGCGVSMPFKEAILPLLDEIESEAREIGAVNTVVQEQGRLRGYNTDWSAVRAALAEAGVPREARVALAGSGGMAKACAHALHRLGVRDCAVIARNEGAGRRLAERYGFAWQREAGGGRYDLLVNATPVGMGTEEIPFSRALVGEARWVCDAVATPPETALVRQAKSLEKSAISGFRITVLQGAEQFRLYTGVELRGEQIERASRHVLEGLGGAR